MKRKQERINLVKAREAQLKIASRAVIKDALPRRIKWIVGVDVSYKGGKAFSAAVKMDSVKFEVDEASYCSFKARAPYIPTYLFLREMGPMLCALKKLREPPDVIFVDANGILHPFKAGEATLIGVLMDKPTIGVAKSLLCGETKETMMEGVKQIILNEEVVGFEVKPKKSYKPFYVSPGHKVSLETALKLSISLTKTKLPEPILKAHVYSRRKALTFSS